ncbi:MAG TPA: hypothetical protein VF630_13920 [Hymenobacter sp.]
MIITTNPDLSLQYDEALGLLRIEWASGQDMRNFRAAAVQLLQLAGQLDVRHLLLDINTFPDISVYDQVWLGVHWMPVLCKLPLEQLVLAIGRRRVHNQMALDSLIALSRPFIKFDIQFFPTAIPGLHWLSNYSERLPGLLAEWDAVHGPGLPAPGGLSELRSSYYPGL